MIVVCTVLLLFVVRSVTSHGLMENPPSRNWLCGAITKPHEVQNGGGLYPECKDAFDSVPSSESGYWFMSVLTHDLGRAGASPLPTHVCGFDSETWENIGDGATPWDATNVDWPVTTMTAGRTEITWNIAWGPHFDDTEEFRYWITKDDFVYDGSVPLTWNDFEPFCVLPYNHASPTANPDVVSNVQDTTFKTYCTVPSRSGRHVIYGEWGRNEWTYERFHGCIDVVFPAGPTSPTTPAPTSPAPVPTPTTTPPVPVPTPTTLAPIPTPEAVSAVISVSPSDPTIVGSTTLALSASASTGTVQSYAWYLTTTGDRSLYSIDTPTAESTTLSIAEPSAEQSFTIHLSVTDSSGVTSTDDLTFQHEPTLLSLWTDLGALTSTPGQHLATGTELSILIINSSGVETYYPSQPLILSDSNRWATNWPWYLAQAMPSHAPIVVGVLDTNSDQVTPVWEETTNRIYKKYGEDVVSAFLEISQPTGGGGGGTTNCVVSFQGQNPWWAGLDVGFDTATAVLDFSISGLDLSTVTQIEGVFVSVFISGQTLTLTKPGWVSFGSKGYLGLKGNNNAALASFSLPNCG